MFYSFLVKRFKETKASFFLMKKSTSNKCSRYQRNRNILTSSKTYYGVILKLEYWTEFSTISMKLVTSENFSAFSSCFQQLSMNVSDILRKLVTPIRLNLETFTQYQRKCFWLDLWAASFCSFVKLYIIIGMKKDPLMLGSEEESGEFNFVCSRGYSIFIFSRESH